MKLDNNKINYLRELLRNIWDDYNFYQGNIEFIDYDYELDAMISFVENNPGLEPQEYNEAFLNIMHGDEWKKFEVIFDD